LSREDTDRALDEWRDALDIDGPPPKPIKLADLSGMGIEVIQQPPKANG
jgi:hypothetical protein